MKYSIESYSMNISRLTKQFVVLGKVSIGIALFDEQSKQQSWVIYIQDKDEPKDFAHLMFVVGPPQQDENGNTTHPVALYRESEVDEAMKGLEQSDGTEGRTFGKMRSDHYLYHIVEQIYREENPESSLVLVN